MVADGPATPPAPPAPPASSSRLFHAPDSAVLLIDIPRSLDESQVPPGHPPTRRIVSAPAALKPFVVPEPRYGHAQSRSQAAQVADLMTQAAVASALDVVTDRYDGPWCLPRVTSATSGPGAAGSNLEVPPSAQYIHGPLHDTVQKLATTASAFDLIVLDPPWPNRSARRRSDKYDTVKNLAEMRDLLSQIPMQGHLAPDGIVAIWITNRESVHDFVVSPGGLFSTWGLQLVSEWTWVKVTASGEPITPLDSAWRKPWEKLLIAQRVESTPRPTVIQPRILVAVPDVHSRKPNLRGVFEDVLGQAYTALEVFARNLTAGWWSWGNEVLHFQSPDHWVVDQNLPRDETIL